MTGERRSLRVAIVVLMGSLTPLLGSGAAAQGSPYVSLDDPRLRFLEHLIARGDIDDPSPHVRPLLERDVLSALRSASRDSMSTSGKIAHDLLSAWEQPLSEYGWWRLAANVGTQVYSQPRRDLLQPVGTPGIRPYADATGAAGQGPLVLVVRPAFEPRLRDDPEYRGVGLGGSWKNQARLVEGYVAGQWHWLGVHSGQVQRNWGPSGLVGIPVSDYAYPRTDIALSLGNRTLRYQILRASLRDVSAGAGRRWFAASRLDLRVRKGLDLSLWESSILLRPPNSNTLDAVARPFFIVTFADRFGAPRGRRNAIVGGDATWRPARRLMLQAQLAIDDMSNYGVNPKPDRYGLGLLAAGALGSSMSWRVRYSMNSSLAYTSPDSNLSFTDSQVGIGRNFIDNDLYSIGLTVPLHTSWLIQPEAQLLRQGEGNLQRPWPDSASPKLPLLWIGTRRDTWQASVGVVGHTRAGASDVQLSALAGYQLSRNAFHVGGKSETRFVARLQATIGWRTGRQEVDGGAVVRAALRRRGGLYAPVATRPQELRESRESSRS